MDITPLIPADRQVIDGYAPGRFQVHGAWYDGAVIVFPDHTLSWNAPSFDALTLETFRPVIENQAPPEILLLGAGPAGRLLPRSLRGALREAGIVVETMDSGAACRTYNVLLAEGRRVAAALLPV